MAYVVCKADEVVKVAVIMTAMTIVVVVLVRATLKAAAAEKPSDSSVFNKILLNHLQMLIITSDFDMDWPPQVQQIFAVAAPINELTNAIVNFDCFMDGRKLDEVDAYDFALPEGEMRVSYQKVIIMSSLPVVLGGIAYVTWWIICRCTRTMGQLRTKFIATLVFLLFLIHPAMTKRMVDIFDCRDYGGIPRMVQDYQVQCFSDSQHIFVAFYIALPCLILWGLGIPAAVYMLMAKTELGNKAAKQQFGFLFNGYKRHNYYWEIVIMYRKILCVFIAVFLRPYGVIVQALVLLLMLGAFLQANNQARPFSQRQLNDIESMSVATQIITIYCGIFFISAKDPSTDQFEVNSDFHLTASGEVILVIVIAACNALFLLLWIMKFVDISRDMIRTKLPKVYTALFLCGRGDKMEREAARRAGVMKREKVIATIEDTVLFLKKMKKIYANNIFYEDHERFQILLYTIASE